MENSAKGVPPKPSRDSENPAPAVFTKTAWMLLAGVKKTRYYALPSTHRPLTILVGVTEMVHEQPGAWAARLAAQQAQDSARAAISAQGDAGDLGAIAGPPGGPVQFSAAARES